MDVCYLGRSGNVAHCPEAFSLPASVYVNDISQSGVIQVLDILTLSALKSYLNDAIHFDENQSE